MNLEDRIEALENAARPKKTEWLVINDGETVAEAEARTGLKESECEFVFQIRYRKEVKHVD